MKYNRGDIVVPLKSCSSQTGKASVTEGVMEMICGISDQNIWFNTTGSGNGSWNNKDFRIATGPEVVAFNQGKKKVQPRSEILSEYQIY